MKINKKKIKFERMVLYMIGYLFAAIWLIPLLWMVITSFKPEGAIITILSELIRPPFTVDSYQKVTETALIGRWTFNSLAVAIIQTSGTVFFSSMAAFSISQMEFPGKKAAFLMILIGLMVPVEATVVPLFDMVVELGWVNSYKALIFPGLTMPLGVLVLKQFYDSIPYDLVEAAKIDGANMFRVWWNIFLPLSRTSMAAISIFVFIQSWNRFLWPLLAASDSAMMTLPVAIPTFQSSFNTDMSVPMAANVLASLPALIAFLLFQKQIIKGVTMTGIK